MFSQGRRSRIILVCLILILFSSKLATASFSSAQLPLRSGSRGEDVRLLQQALRDLGYAVGSIDGIFGRQTELALRSYQRDRGITVDGLAGRQTIAMLQRDQQTKPVEVDRGHMHVVRPGETLHSIASRYQLTWIDLMDFNHLHNPNRVFVGQALFIPGPNWEPTPKPPPMADPELPIRTPSQPVAVGAVALTFNDSPHPEYTLKILNILQEHEINATFFVVGSLAETNPDLVRLIAQRGHDIGNHSYSHQSLRGRPPHETEREITSASRVIADLTGQETHLFRPPGGGYDTNTRVATANAGHNLVMWTNISAQTPFNGSTDALVDRIVQHVYDGCILMLHDGSQQTLDALPAVIAGIKARDFTFVTLNGQL